MFETLFEALFRYRPVVFQQGEFRFDITGPALSAAALAGIVMVAAVVTYRGVRHKGRLRDRLVLTTMRMAILALIVFCLFRPTLVVRAAVPQQNVVAVLLDDSRSMQIPDWQGQARGEFVRRQFGSAESPIIKALSERFLVRTFRFSSSAARIESEDGADVQRLADAARRRRWRARAKSWPGCRCPVSSWCPTARTRATSRSATPCSG